MVPFLGKRPTEFIRGQSSSSAVNRSQSQSIAVNRSFSYLFFTTKLAPSLSAPGCTARSLAHEMAMLARSRREDPDEPLTDDDSSTRNAGSILHAQRDMINQKQDFLREARLKVSKAERELKKAQDEVLKWEQSCLRLKADYYAEKDRERDGLPHPLLALMDERSRRKRSNVNMRETPPITVGTGRRRGRTQRDRGTEQSATLAVRSTRPRRIDSGVAASDVRAGEVDVAEGRGQPAEERVAPLRAASGQDAPPAEAPEAPDVEVPGERESIQRVLDNLEGYRINDTDNEPGIDYVKLKNNCKEAHRMQHSWSSPSEEERLDFDGMTIYCYRGRAGGRGAAEGRIFWRFMVWLQMQAQLNGFQHFCALSKYDNSNRGSGRVRLTVWSFLSQGPGDDMIKEVREVFRQNPTALLSVSSQHEHHVKVGLGTVATADQRLRALFCLLSTPMGYLIDQSSLSNEQLRALWNHIIAACNARPGELDTATRMLDACVEHANTLGFKFVPNLGQFSHSSDA